MLNMLRVRFQAPLSIFSRALHVPVAPLARPSLEAFAPALYAVPAQAPVHAPARMPMHTPSIRIPLVPLVPLVPAIEPELPGSACMSMLTVLIMQHLKHRSAPTSPAASTASVYTGLLCSLLYFAHSHRFLKRVTTA